VADLPQQSRIPRKPSPHVQGVASLGLITSDRMSADARPVPIEFLVGTGLLGAIAELEQRRINKRVRAGLARAKAQGKRLGRQPYAIAPERFDAVAVLSLRDPAASLGVSRSVVHWWRLSRKPVERGTHGAR
jgi:hypothetical protein